MPQAASSPANRATAPARRPLVSFVFPIAHHYRLPFHERVRALLDVEGIDYTVVYSDPPAANRKRKDTVTIPWGQRRACLRLKGLQLQNALPDLKRSDLLVVQQENALLFNYLAVIASRLGWRKVAYFGHGRNFQATNPNALPERFKRFWATKIDWWFAYTEDVARYLEGIDYPPERITVFNNAIDVQQLRDDLASIQPDEVARYRADLGIPADAPVGVFVGGIYDLKRMPYLVAAATRIRQAVANFHLLIVGGGVDQAIAERAATAHDFIHFTGPQFGRDKAMALKAGDVFLMPGLMGLAILDAYCAALPVFTADVPYHSPEIAYLKPGETGEMVAHCDDPQAFADPVIRCLQDEEGRRRMAANAEAMAAELTIERMAERFCAGVLRLMGRRAATQPQPSQGGVEARAAS